MARPPCGRTARTSSRPTWSSSRSRGPPESPRGGGSRPSARSSRYRKRERPAVWEKDYGPQTPCPRPEEISFVEENCRTGPALAGPRHLGVPRPAGPGGGRFNGILAQGDFDATKFVGPLAGKPMSALVETLTAGTAYVNIHTDDGVAPPNTGPGDFPGGEIRGQVKPTD